MKVKYKLPLGFISVALLVWIVGLSAIIASKNNLETTIESYSVASLSQIAHYLDKDIYSKIEYFLGRTKGAAIQQEIYNSNYKYSQISNPLNIIQSEDEEWRNLPADSVNNLIMSLASKKLSQSLREEMKVFEYRYHMPLFTEILVTDSLGALVAQTGRASDYYQGDEEWWQDARQNGLFLTEFTYDESSRTYAMEICLRITNKEDKFVGVIKAVVGIQNFLNNINKYLQQDTIITKEDALYTIIDKNGKVLFSTAGYNFMQMYPRYNEVRKLLNSGINKMEYTDETTENHLAFFKTGSGLLEFKGFGWIVIAEYHERVIFSGIYYLRNQIILSCVIITILGLVFSFLISKNLLKPIKALHSATERISKGNYDFNLDLKSGDELGDLSRSFKEMSNKINEYNSKLLMQTEELSQINSNLQNEVAERINAQNSLAQETEKLFITLKSISDAVIATNNEGKITIINNAAEQLFGINHVEVLGSKIEDVVKIAEKPLWSYADIIKIFSGTDRQNDFTEQVTIRSSSGREFTALNSISPILDATGNVNGIVIISKDITERSKIEKQLIESETKFRDLFNNSVLGIFRTSIEGRFLDVNPAFAKMFRYNSPKEVVETVTDISTEMYVSAEDRKRIIQELKSGPGFGVFETDFKTKDGHVLKGSMHIRVEKDKEGKFRFLEGFVEDVTERKTAEENFFKIFNSSPEWISISTIDEGRFVIANHAFYNTFELNPENVIGHTDRELNLWVEHNYRNKVVAVVKEDGVLKNVEIKLRSSSGRILTCLVSFEIIQYSGIPHLIILGRDITERKEWEDSLANEKERLSVTLRSIGDGVITTDVDGRVTLINRVAEKLTGYSQNEAVGKPLEEIFYIVDADTGQKRDNPFEKVIKANLITELETNTKLIAKDGTERIIADSGSPIRDKNSQIIGVALVFRDVTQKRKIEEELQKVQKIESIGVLAGGLAHDFNNILTSIVGSISLAMLKPDVEHKDKYLRLAENAALRAKDLTQQLLTFSKGGDPVKKLTSLDNVVRMSSSFAASGSNSEIEFEVEKNLWKTEVDEGQISQVVNNIVLNAIQAMPGGGKVKIKLYNYSSGQSKDVDMHGNYVAIKISDTGAGMNQDVVKKIFDPYFTTKQKGSGLGLAISYSIIKKHNGFIDVRSEPGKGTDFVVYLPASDKKTERHESPFKSAAKGKGYILVMDDEESIRLIMQDILNMLGYTVDTAIDGKEAIEKYNKSVDAGKPYDLIIMDLTIPGGMGGKETISKLLEINPDIKAIVSSGYSNDPVLADYVKYGFKGTIAKPYRVDEVSKIVNMVINQK